MILSNGMATRPRSVLIKSTHSSVAEACHIQRWQSLFINICTLQLLIWLLMTMFLSCWDDECTASTLQKTLHKYGPEIYRYKKHKQCLNEKIQRPTANTLYYIMLHILINNNRHNLSSLLLRGHISTTKAPKNITIT